MIHLVNLTLAYGPQVLLEGVNWHVGPNDRIGLVGNNGSGKSTLMKAIIGFVQPDEGDVVAAKHVSMGYLPQDGVVHEGRTLYDEAASAFGDLAHVEETTARLLGEMQHHDEESPEFKRLGKEYAELEERIRINDAYQLEEKVAKVLGGLGFKPDDMGRDCGEFSGGWQMRIALAKVLLAQPNMLLLDEPTNYLDIEAREFLEGWLKNYPHAVLLVSHDRHFLDQVVGRITEIHAGELSDYYCNYSRYLVEREERLERLRAEAEQVEAERARIQAFINRFRYKADKAALVQSRVKQLEKLKEIKLPPVRKKIRFRFPQPERSGKIALEVENLSAGYGDGPDILKSLDFRLPRGEKVALVGVNGAGKSTLMRVLAGQLEPRAGEYRFGHNVSMDYFAQDIHKTLDTDASVYDTLERISPFDMVPQLRKLLGAFLFSGDDIDKRVGVLSGGERNRLALARMLLQPSNLLLMDEPTNHLDIDAKDVLLSALKGFSGTVLFVSHDRYFLDHLATSVYALNDGELYVYPGSYPDFVRHAEARGLGETDDGPSEEEIEQQEVKALDKAERVARYEEEKKQKRERERLKKRVVELEAEVEQKEAAIKALTEEMIDPALATNFARLDELSQKKETLSKKMEALTDEWEAALLRLEEIGD